MRNIAVFAAVAFAALLVVMAHAGPAYAAQSTVAVNNSGVGVDTVVGTESTVPAQLIRRGGHGHGGRAFRSGGYRSFRGGHFNRFHFRPYGFYRPLGYSSVYAPYYSSYNNCVWNGYQWVCYKGLY